MTSVGKPVVRSVSGRAHGHPPYGLDRWATLRCSPSLNGRLPPMSGLEEDFQSYATRPMCTLAFSGAYMDEATKWDRSR
jgi:hypothetical protein